MREDDAQKRVVIVMKLYGGEVYNMSQGYRPGGKRHGTTRQTKGIADLLIFFPRWKTHIWFEVKKRDDDWPLDNVEWCIRRPFYVKLQSADQAAFEAHCTACGVRYVLGGMEEAQEVCKALKRADIRSRARTALTVEEVT